ncbi:diadenylate cyclase [Priestia megaterium]|uniref:diadenylate cyclase n=1 Tax=Priestia megaterium TaxID=1404 RepID=UPI00317B8BB5
MKKINEIYYTLKKLFGPLISVEIVNSSDIDNIEHVIGEPIVNSIMNRNTLNTNEIKHILKDKINSSSENKISIIEATSLRDMLKLGIGVEDNVVVNLDQFPMFSRIINFHIKDIRYTVIISTPVFENVEDQDTLRDFWQTVVENRDNNKNLTVEFLKKDMPGYLKDNFEELINLLIQISMTKIESKSITTGLIFVGDYDYFKDNFYSDLFLDLQYSYDIRDIDKVKQPFLEITNGHKSFLVVDKEFNIKGLMFPDKTISGLYPYIADYKKIYNSLIVRVEGTSLIRAVLNDKIVFEIENGIIRKRNYSFFTLQLEKALKELNVNSSYYDDIKRNLLMISNIGKGTIIIIGNRLNKNKYSGGIPCDISVLKKRNRDKRENVYRDTILSQLSNTDGAILMDKNLNIYRFGALLKVKSTDREEDFSGGSRSYTAKKFSEENPDCIVIKISEDGPISLYFGGECKIQI